MAFLPMEWRTIYYRDIAWYFLTLDNLFEKFLERDDRCEKVSLQWKKKNILIEMKLLGRKYGLTGND